MKKKLLLSLLILFISIFMIGIKRVYAIDVAEVDGESYESISLALDSITDSGKKTVKLLANTQENITISNDKNIVLDLQNHTMTNSGNNAVITNDGTLEVKNGTITSSAGTGAVNNNSKGSLTISSGTIKTTGTKQGVYNNGGTVKITGSTYIESSSNQRAAVHNLKNGIITITGGTIKSTGAYAIYNEEGNLTIGIKDDLYDTSIPIIQGKTYGVITNNDINVYDGTISGNTYPVGIVTATGTNPSISKDTDITKVTGIEADSTKDVDTTNKTLIYNIDTSNRSRITYNPVGGAASKDYQIVYRGDSIGTLPSAIKVDNEFNGWFTSSTGGEQITENTKPMRDTTYYAHWTYVDPNTVAYVEGVGHTSLANALTLGGKIRLEKDVMITTPLVMNKNATLDLNGHTLDLRNNSLTIKKEVTITDTSTLQTGKITSTSDFTVVVSSTGKLNHKGGTIEGLGSYGAIRNYGNLVIDGGTVQGTATTKLGYVVYNDKNMTMKSGTIYSSNGRAVQVYTNATFTMDGGLLKSDAIKDQTLNLYGDCSATINGGTIEGLNDDTAAIAMFHNTTLTVNGGTIKGNAMGIAGNGNEKNSNANITINGGDISATDGVGMYLPQMDSTTIINGGNIIGPTGIEIRAANLIVNGGNITGTSDVYEVIPNDSGTTSKGAAIAVVQHTTQQPIHVVINGGNLKSAAPIAEDNPMDNPPEAIEKVVIEIKQGNFEATGDEALDITNTIPLGKFISGGTYTSDPTNYVKDGYEVIKLADNKYLVTRLNSIIIDNNSKKYISVDKDKYYINDIVEVNVKEGYTIEVIDSNGNKIKVTNNTFIMPDSDVTIKAKAVKGASEDNPPTGDNIITYIGILVISSIALLVALIYKKKKIS